MKFNCTSLQLNKHHFRRVLCLLDGSTTHNKKIKQTSFPFAVMLRHAENANYRVKYEYLEPFSDKKKKKIKCPLLLFFKNPDEKHVLFLLGLIDIKSSTCHQSVIIEDVTSKVPVKFWTFEIILLQKRLDKYQAKISSSSDER